MAKLFQTDEEIVKIIDDVFAQTGLDRYGINLKVMSVQKAKDMIKVSRASAATEFLSKNDDIVQVFVYEDAFNQLDDESAKFMVEFAMSGVAYDSEKDKIIIESNPYQYLFNMRKKYGNRADEILEASYLTIKQLQDKKSDEEEAQPQK